MAARRSIEGRIIALTFKNASPDAEECYVHVRLPEGEVLERRVSAAEWYTLAVGGTYTVERETR